jgi:hypothetical protein
MKRGFATERLRPKMPEALAMLLNGESLGEVAWRVGVHPRTVSRWANGPGPFRAALEQALRERGEAREMVRRMNRGEVRPTAARVRMVCLVLGISPRELKGEPQEPRHIERDARAAQTAMRKYLGDPNRYAGLKDFAERGWYTRRPYRRKSGAAPPNPQTQGPRGPAERAAGSEPPAGSEPGRNGSAGPFPPPREDP